jgi:cyanate permease
MNNMILHLVIWAVLATVVVFLALYRRHLYMKSDELLHVLDAEAPMIGSQAETAKKLEKIDFWGKTLTVIVGLYALAIGGMYIYRLFNDTSIRMN